MIRALVDYALNNRFLVTAAALILLIWGAISFHALPVEAYPDVANNYVQVITQWPGRATEEVERQVTIPVEIVMNGIPHLEHLRSTSLFGLSSVMLIFDDDSANDWNRQKGVILLEYINQLRARGETVLRAAIDGSVERLLPIMMTMLAASVGLLPAALSRGIGSDSQRPFAIVIVGGLVAALFLGVYLLPALYVWVAGDDDVLPGLG